MQHTPHAGVLHAFQGLCTGQVHDRYTQHAYDRILMIPSRQVEALLHVQRRQIGGNSALKQAHQGMAAVKLAHSAQSAANTCNPHAAHAVPHGRIHLKQEGCMHAQSALSPTGSGAAFCPLDTALVQPPHNAMHDKVTAKQTARVRAHR
jgi:hypothetical protein